MTKCTQCGATYSVNPAYTLLIENLKHQGHEVVGHHFQVCIECLKKDDEYLNYCSSFFRQTGIDICVY